MATAVVHLITSDNHKFRVDQGVAMLSRTVYNALNDAAGTPNEAIPLPNVTAEVLTKVLQWCEHHYAEGMTFQIAQQFEQPDRMEELPVWDKEFISVDDRMLEEIVAAADYLDIRPLMHVALKTFVRTLENKGVDDIRRMLHIVDPFPPDVEVKIRAENAWAEKIVKQSNKV